ncbi:MAG: hypothetical protein ACD_42C00450G0001 [uncultured bacterium]|nr:MAG: hypothetical protein ACD_42C00450G0001 [uncultured bacterium]OGT34526.1 MAG: hypothetical protein A3C44_08200 [Gammaproteobacteria bacterium RIFCSPHIGHO2_02_FULL_39_13]OGT50587.1 MAG: hypothetical protein A3E53_03610 [Gammaproteobacteria bacterium RIFCSPHIGHO2_12_FULL_39_24]
MLLTVLHEMNIHLRTSIFCLSCVAIAVAFILLLVASITFQKPVRGSVSRGAEIVWAVIPLVMLSVMLIPVANVFVHQHKDALCLTHIK